MNQERISPSDFCGCRAEIPQQIIGKIVIMKQIEFLIDNR